LSVEERLPTLREYIKTLLSDKEKVREELFKLTEQILDKIRFIWWYRDIELPWFLEFDLDNMSFRKESEEKEYKCPDEDFGRISCKDIPVNSFRYKYVFNKSE